MIVSAHGSLTERLTHADDFRAELLLVLQEKSAELTDWINGFHLIDKHLVVFILETTAEALRSQLTPTEEIFLGELHRDLSTMVVEFPVARRDKDEED